MNRDLDSSLQGITVSILLLAGVLAWGFSKQEKAREQPLAEEQALSMLCRRFDAMAERQLHRTKDLTLSSTTSAAINSADDVAKALPSELTRLLAEIDAKSESVTAAGAIKAMREMFCVTPAAPQGAEGGR